MKKLPLIIGLMFILSFTIVLSDTNEQQNIGGTGANVPFRYSSPYYYYKGNITTNTTFSLKNLSVNFQKFGTPTGSIWVEIYNSTGSESIVVNTSRLAISNVVDGSTFSSSAGGSYANFTFNTSYPVYAGQTLTYVFASNTASSTSNYYRAVEKATTGNNPTYGTGAGTWTRDTVGNQFNYQMWSTPAPPSFTFNTVNIANTTFTYNTSPWFTINGTKVGTWNVSLYVNGTKYNSNTSFVSDSQWTLIINSPLTVGREYEFWFNATGDASAVTLSNKYRLFIAGSYPILGGFYVSNQCSVISANGGYYIQ